MGYRVSPYTKCKWIGSPQLKPLLSLSSHTIYQLYMTYTNNIPIIPYNPIYQLKPYTNSPVLVRKAMNQSRGSRTEQTSTISRPDPPEHPASRSGSQRCTFQYGEFKICLFIYIYINTYVSGMDRYIDRDR